MSIGQNYANPYEICVTYEISFCSMMVSRLRKEIWVCLDMCWRIFLYMPV